MTAFRRRRACCTTSGGRGICCNCGTVVRCFRTNICGFIGLVGFLAVVSIEVDDADGATAGPGAMDVDGSGPASVVGGTTSASGSSEMTTVSRHSATISGTRVQGLVAVLLDGFHEWRSPQVYHPVRHQSSGPGLAPRARPQRLCRSHRCLRSLLHQKCPATVPSQH